MPRVLLTAFKPYGRWKTNASWLALVELTKDFPAELELTTRLYPVDYAAMRQQLEDDLAGDYDFAIHLGQAPGSGRLRLEAIGLNVRDGGDDADGDFPPLEPEGPEAQRTDLPLAAWAKLLREKQIPAEVSCHAGTYLCNATLYYSLLLSRRKKLRTRSMFLHLPLDISQVVTEEASCPALPAALSAEAIRLLLGQMLYV